MKQTYEVPVLSKAMNRYQTMRFFNKLTVGDRFGFSAKYTLDQVKILAQSYGYRVNPVDKRSKLGKKYGKYVVRVKELVSPVTKKEISEDTRKKVLAILELVNQIHKK